MIRLNDILKLTDDELKLTKIRLNLQFDGNYHPIEFFKSRDDEQAFQKMLDGNYYNFTKKSYQVGNISLGFVRLPKSYGDHLYLLFHAGKVTEDLNKQNAVGYRHEELEQYKKYCGRLVIRYKNSSQNMIRKAIGMIDECEVVEILPSDFDDDVFPGYDNVFVSWQTLNRVLQKSTWRTALQNQKGVYLIIDDGTGKFYVGSAYGSNMLFGRWQDYANSRHGGNVELKNLSNDYIENNFYYAILEIFKSTVDDEVVIQRESYWKKVLLTRKFGHNLN